VAGCSIDRSARRFFFEKNRMNVESICDQLISRLPLSGDGARNSDSSNAIAYVEDRRRPSAIDRLTTNTTVTTNRTTILGSRDGARLIGQQIDRLVESATSATNHQNARQYDNNRNTSNREMTPIDNNHNVSKMIELRYQVLNTLLCFCDSN
jgi:hypothetical protein